MAIAQTRTLLSLDQFAEIMAVSPFAINQLDITKLGVEMGECELWYQYPWQSGVTITREILGQAISEAEHTLAEHLGFWPAPRFTTDEKIPYPRPCKAEYWNVWFSDRWKLKSVRTEYGKLWSMGIEAHTVIAADTPVTLTDQDGDGFDDWFSVGPIATTVTEECEIGVYYRDADRPVGLPISEEGWRIRPVKVEISGGNVTVSGSLWLIVDPDNFMGPTPGELDPTLAATFVDGLKLQRVYTDTTDQGICSLEHVVCYGTECSNVEVDACFGQRNAERGVILPEATATSWPLGPPENCCAAPYYAPDFIKVNYLSGHALSINGGVCRVAHVMAQMIARYAVTLLPDRLCEECGEAQIDFWRGVLPDDERETMTELEAGNPLGDRRGAVWTWKRVQDFNENKRVGAIF